MKSMINESNFNDFAKLTDIASRSNGIDNLLKMVGSLFDSNQICLFEFSSDRATFSNLYQHSLLASTDYIKYLSNEPIDQIDWFFEYFNSEKPVIVDSIENIKLSHPQTYSLLKSQNIDSFIASPMTNDAHLLGFMLIYNPNTSLDDKQRELLRMYSVFVGRSLTILTLTKQNHRLQTHDPTTLALNRSVFEIHIQQMKDSDSLAIACFDVAELNKLNHAQGYEAGNRLLCKLGEALIHIFRYYPVYRTGGDEFTILCKNISRYDFDYHMSEVKRYISQLKHHIFIGTAYKDSQSFLTAVQLLSAAEHDLYKEKANYYCEIDPASGISRERRSSKKTKNVEAGLSMPDSILGHYMQDNYFDIEAFMASWSLVEYYPYFGDLQSNAFYISEPLCKILGLNYPVVQNLFGIWENFIPEKEEQEMYRNDWADILDNKRETRDLRYKLKDVSGNEFWIRSFGVIKWNEDKSKPLFVSGAISKLGNGFILDPVTDLPKEQLVPSKITEYSAHYSLPPTFIGFKINNFEEINELRGRSVANSLLKHMSGKILSTYKQELDLYRLDGLRFLAIVHPSHTSRTRDIAVKIKEIISEIYKEYNISVRFPSVVGIIDDQVKNYSPVDVVSDILSLVEVAKSSPESDYVLYSDVVESHKSRNLMMMALNRDVADGFKNFYTVIQPVVAAKSHKIISGELLLRWKYEDENVSPMVFVPMLEQQGLIVQVGNWVFEQAACHCKRMLTLNPDFYLNFNISYHQIVHDEFVPYMQSIFKKWQLEPKALVAELTETHYNDNPVKLNEFIESCRSIGLRIALDDFGVGYSSLDLLLQYHSDVVKLDRSLVQSMVASEKSNDFIASIVYACHKFGKTVCVEGVETAEELELVENAGCDMIQGYYFYKPMHIGQVYELLVDNS